MYDTIFKEQIGKWQLGTSGPDGRETALMGKWIGEAPAKTYPSYSVGIPERLEVGSDLVLGFLLGLAANWVYDAMKKRR